MARCSGAGRPRHPELGDVPVIVPDSHASLTTLLGSATSRRHCLEQVEEVRIE